MDAQWYERLYAPFRTDPRRRKALILLSRVLTGSVYAAYPVLLLTLALAGDARLPAVAVIPALGFVFVSVFRKGLNRPRPYEVFGVPPVMPKQTKGKSFPSRHVFCVFMIASAFGYIFPSLGAVLVLIGIGIAAVRVIGGVHFVKDAAAGAALGLGLGALGFAFLSPLLRFPM